MTLPIQIPYDNVTMDIDAQDKHINANGVLLEHWKAVKCPIGVIDNDDGRSPHFEHSVCENGYVYVLSGFVKAMFISNSATAILSDAGILDGSVVNVTFPRFYSDKPTEQIYVQMYDRFYIKDCPILVVNTQSVEAHLSGRDRLTYKAQKADGKILDSQGKWYSEGIDFNIIDGTVIWSGDNRPGFDLNTDKGTSYSIRYLYTPFFYVSRLMHEVRVASKSDFKTSTVSYTRTSYQALLAREYYLYKKETNDRSFEDQRPGMTSPRSTIFGPR